MRGTHTKTTTELAARQIRLLWKMKGEESAENSEFFGSKELCLTKIVWTESETRQQTCYRQMSQYLCLLHRQIRSLHQARGHCYQNWSPQMRPCCLQLLRRRRTRSLMGWRLKHIKFYFYYFYLLFCTLCFIFFTLYFVPFVLYFYLLSCILSLLPLLSVLYRATEYLKSVITKHFPLSFQLYMYYVSIYYSSPFSILYFCICSGR